MSEQELTAKMDTALAQVDPGRRKFLGILLAGAAALPLLSSADLAAEDKPGAQKTQVFPKNAASTKGDTALKNNSAIWIKSNSSATKNNNAAIKLTNAQAHKNNSGATKSNSASIKLTNAQALKNSSGAHKNSSGAQKNSGATPDAVTFGREKIK
jgi:hypothetical protein